MPTLGEAPAQAHESLEGRHRLADLPWEIVGPLLLSLALGLWGLTSAGLWIDERDTLLAADYPLWRLWELPLLPFYGVMWAWTLGGSIDSDFWLRLPSVIAMALAVGITALAARRLAGRRGALIAGVAMALAPSVSRYSQEARVYAFATLLTAAATWLLLVAFDKRQRRWWVGYGIALISIGIMAPFALSIVVGHTLIALSSKGHRQSIRSWIFSCAAVVPVVILDLYLFSRFGFMHQWAAPPVPLDLVNGLFFMVGSMAFAAALIAWSLLNRQGSWWLAASAAAVASVWLISIGPSSFWQERSLVPLVPLLAVAGAVSLARFGWPAAGIGILLLAVISLPILDGQRQPGARGLDPQAIARIIDENGQPGDVINTAINNWLSWGIEHYLPGDPRFSFAESAPGRAWVLDDAVPCVRLAEYQVPPEGLLVLCESLPVGWEDDVVRN